ncbi:cilia- and flagella-associated protein 418 [Danio aesculapii]|uniref:cilia- and flagella-associated protein 418 n=1 Tax=Danio aesculapii TaxID=1142201 RepID=UPI0024C01C9F|nr:cilia- and flagella-associated protein 418 [Danio aesculapii]
MADDLDDLLDEVESKFCCSTSESKQTSRVIKQTDQKCENLEDKKQPRKQGFKRVENEIDIDAMLHEILDDDDDKHTSTHEPSPAKASSSDSRAQTITKKCCPVFLGGSSVAHGIGTSVSERACNRLRCTYCDFSVITFDDHEWDSSCDYLFFRNNMPDYHKLKVHLRRRVGVRAYACQCSWISILTLSHLREQPQLKWVCGKHRA